MLQASTVIEAVNTYNIPPELIINIDQMSLVCMLISKYSVEEKSASRVFVPGSVDYKQTGTFGIALSVYFLTIQLIYQRKIALSRKKFRFPSEFYIVQTPNLWANESTSINLFLKSNTNIHVTHTTTD